MENYLYISAFISIVVLFFIHYGKGTSNANYYLSCLAIIAWFIPYNLLAELIPKEALRAPIILAFSEITTTLEIGSDQLIYLNVDLWFMWVFVGLMSIGAILFIKRFINSVVWRHQIMNDPSLVLLKEYNSTDKHTVYSSKKVSSGLLLGIINPVIIISKQITDPKHIALILSHEKQHLRSLDNLRLLLLELAECLFWWNPLVRKLVHINRFFIEARCDENASIYYGKSAYISDLASLILTKHHNEHSHFVCSAGSNFKNNIARIKLLKEKRNMNFKRKLTYTLIVLTTITTISWNTFATATNSEITEHRKAEQKEIGALVDFDVIINTKRKGDRQDTYRYQVTFWVKFDEMTRLEIGEENYSEGFIINFKAKDSGELASLEYELIESTMSDEKIVSKPSLSVKFGEEAIIEIDNAEVSKYSYLIKTTPTKSINPNNKDI
jgi:beta-lactamase regulating signal transducer with metallopeptidase domain